MTRGNAPAIAYAADTRGQAKDGTEQRWLEANAMHDAGGAIPKRRGSWREVCGRWAGCCDVVERRSVPLLFYPPQPNKQKVPIEQPQIHKESSRGSPPLYTFSSEHWLLEFGFIQHLHLLYKDYSICIGCFWDLWCVACLLSQPHQLPGCKTSVTFSIHRAGDVLVRVHTLILPLFFLHLNL